MMQCCVFAVPRLRGICDLGATLDGSEPCRFYSTIASACRTLIGIPMKEFWLCFVPLFVAVDAIGILPIFLSLTHGLGPRPLRRIVYQSVITAAVVALAFMAVGEGVLRLLNLTVADFMVAGGVLLFVIAMSDLLSFEKPHARVDPETLGAVPLGVPMITGPAVLTTAFLLLKQHGLPATALALVANVLIAGIVFHFAAAINRVLGKAGSRTVSKIAHLLLASIAVMLVRKGLVQIAAHWAE